LRRLVIVVVLVAVISVAYHTRPEPETTGTGTLTLSQPSPAPGEGAPSFEATRMNGEEFKMPDDGTYVVSFWSGLNQASQSSRPAFERLAREYSDSKMTFAAVYVGGVPRDDRHNAPYAVIQDDAGELTSLYNVKRVPRIFLVKDGKVRLTQDGFSEEQERDMRRELESTLRSGI
jgi:thiol-disulfide isomerase/thioredoxin